jgi:hypothetical protein
MRKRLVNLHDVVMRVVAWDRVCVMLRVRSTDRPLTL